MILRTSTFTTSISVAVILLIAHEGTVRFYDTCINIHHLHVLLEEEESSPVEAYRTCEIPIVTNILEDASADKALVNITTWTVICRSCPEVC
mmetsp:Transcript_25382/g.30732  ORF Transcript_25382/g.30732 Transcript_25382/m.30732 type:complete len:92 (-) Transcript_25382:5-280(-)